MDKSDATGLAGITIGAGLAVAALALPWEIPNAARHVIFWIGTFGWVAGGLWLAHTHKLNSVRPGLRVGVPALIIFVLYLLAVSIEANQAGNTSAKSQWAFVNKALTPVVGRTFVNERVELDGNDYIDCRFVNVKFVYNGTASFGFIHNNVINSEWVIPGLPDQNPCAQSRIPIDMIVQG